MLVVEPRSHCPVKDQSRRDRIEGTAAAISEGCRNGSMTRRSPRLRLAPRSSAGSFCCRYKILPDQLEHGCVPLFSLIVGKGAEKAQKSNFPII